MGVWRGGWLRLTGLVASLSNFNNLSEFLVLVFLEPEMNDGLTESESRES
jgi:hypothetical protein